MTYWTKYAVDFIDEQLKKNQEERDTLGVSYIRLGYLLEEYTILSGLKHKIDILSKSPELTSEEFLNHR